MLKVQNSIVVTAASALDADSASASHAVRRIEIFIGARQLVLVTLLRWRGRSGSMPRALARWAAMM